MSDPTNQEILNEIQRLHDRLDNLERELRREGRNELPRLSELAEEINVSERTLRRKMDKAGIPVRDSHGFPKEKDDRSAAHVSRSEWESKEELDTQAVRARAGEY
jgi:DeoR/GlpR family transcriptional regulator of sugar metabolism